MSHFDLARVTHIRPVIACLVCGWTAARPSTAAEALSAIHHHICQEHS